MQVLVTGVNQRNNHRHHEGARNIYTPFISHVSINIYTTFTRERSANTMRVRGDFPDVQLLYFTDRISPSLKRSARF